MKRRRPRRVVALLLVAVLGSAGIGHAQAPAITSDGTTGTAVTQVGNAYTIGGGTLRETNLFHSFGRFNVPGGGSATFLGPLSITNIISRVTGGEASTISGLITSRAAMPNANFVLINPAGVIFTAGAQLDVGKAFRVSTADEVRFADGAVFAANPTIGEVLTTAAPTAFGFLGSTPAGISVQGTQLRVAPGETLSVVGGNVTFSAAGRLTAPGGRAEVISVRSPGQVPFAATGLDLGSFASLGDITMSGRSVLDASSTTGGGTVYIRGGRLVVDNSTMAANSISSDGAAVGIDIQVRDDITLSGGALLLARTMGAGRGGSIALDAETVNLSGRSAVRSETLGTGTGGRIAVSAESAMLSGGALVESSADSTARGGDIVVHVRNLDLASGARIFSDSGNIGQPGAISVTASDRVTLSGTGTEIFSGSSRNDVAGGDISLDVRTLSITDRAAIRSGNDSQQGGNISVTARDSLLITGGGGISSQAFARDAGVVAISVPTISIDNGFIDTSTLGSGAAGRIAIDAQRVTLTGGAQIASSSQRDATIGAGGSVTVTASDFVSISGRSSTGVGASRFTDSPNSGIFSIAQGRGAAGDIVVRAPRLTLGDRGTVSAESIATASATGVGGRILLDAAQIDLSGGARVNSGTASAAQGGSIEMRANQLTMTGDGTGLFSNAEAAGAGGTIRVNGRDVTVQNGARLSATSSGTGNAGDIDVVVGNTMNINGGVITTAATRADGGNISITTTGSTLSLKDAQITTSVQSGAGSGGNITIGSAVHPVEFVLLQDSAIRADAFGGPGGNVNIVADVYLTSSSIVSASSTLGVPGTIDIQASITDVSSGITQLPETVLHAATLLRASCAARLASGKSSSLVVTGREGLPPEPGLPLGSPMLALPAHGAQRTHSDQQMPGLAPLAVARTLLPPDCVR